MRAPSRQCSRMRRSMTYRRLASRSPASSLSIVAVSSAFLLLRGSASPGSLPAAFSMWLASRFSHTGMARSSSQEIRSRSRALARESSARTADSLRPNTAGDLCRALTPRWRREATHAAPPWAISPSPAGRNENAVPPLSPHPPDIVALASDLAKVSSSCSGRLRLLRSRARFHAIRTSQTRISRTVESERRCCTTRTKTSCTTSSASVLFLSTELAMRNSRVE